MFCVLSCVGLLGKVYRSCLRGTQAWCGSQLLVCCCCCADDGIADIILGAPFVSSDIQRLRHPEAGAIFVLDGATLPAFGTKILDVANASAAARWGLARHGRFGTAMVTIPGDSKDAVLVSAPMTSGNVSEMGGAVQMLSF